MSTGTALPAGQAQTPPTPGTNSWAQTREQEFKEETSDSLTLKKEANQPTNREKYENKALAKPDGWIPPTRPYIKPAIPLNLPTHRHLNRSVTDPVPQVQALEASKKPIIPQLNRAFGHTKQNSSHQAPPVATGKAAEILGINVDKKSKAVVCHEDQGGMTKSSASSVIEAGSAEAGNLPLTLDPQQRHVRGASNEPVSSTTSSQHIATTGTTEKALSIPVYRQVGDYALVQNPEINRVESVEGIIERAVGDPPTSRDNSSLSGETNHVHSAGAEMLKPVTYSSSKLEGMWENDPAVGRKIPRFTMSHYAASPRLQRSQTSTNQQPMSIVQDGASNSSPKEYWGSRESQYDTDARSAPSESGSYWETLNSGNSFAAGREPPLPLFPPQWSHAPSNNAVPPPPGHQTGYQRPGSLGAELAHLDLTFHHHIDSVFHSLSRQIVEKHDRTLDKFLQRLEKLEFNMGQEVKAVEEKVTTLSVQCKSFQEATHGIETRNEETANTLSSIQEKMGSIATNMQDIHRQCLQALAHTPVSGPTNFNERSSASLAKSIDTFREYPPDGFLEERNSESWYQPSRSEDKKQTRKRGSKGARSSSDSNNRQNYPFDKGRNDKRDRLLGLNLESARSGAPMPDIRHHPAYARPVIDHAAGQKKMFDQNGNPLGEGFASALPFEMQPFTNGTWYQQAYGQR